MIHLELDGEEALALLAAAAPIRWAVKGGCPPQHRRKVEMLGRAVEKLADAMGLPMDGILAVERQVAAEEAAWGRPEAGR